MFTSLARTHQIRNNTARSYRSIISGPLRLRSSWCRTPSTLISQLSSSASASKGLSASSFSLPSAGIAIRHLGRCHSSSSAVKMAPQRRLERPAIFVCDLQEKFRTAIWQFDKIILTTQKLLRGAKILNIPVYVTTQNAARLGATVSELQPFLNNVPTVDKTYFSMWVPEISQHFDPSVPSEVVIVGIESHVCVTQTALDLIEAGHKVYVLADGVSSCNEQEVSVALARLRAEGVTVTTSESFIFECMGDAAIPEFRDVSKLIKETSGDTKTALGGTISKI